MPAKLLLSNEQPQFLSHEEQAGRKRRESVGVGTVLPFTQTAKIFASRLELVQQKSKFSLNAKKLRKKLGRPMLQLKKSGSINETGIK